MQKTKDGTKKFGSAFAARRYDEVHANSDEQKPEPGSQVSHAMHEVKEPVEPKHESEKEGEEEVHPVVQQHGKAHSVHITHDHVNNKHHVKSEHEDGHVNESDHETPEEAHEQGGKLANVSLKKTGEEGKQAGAASEGDNDYTDGFEMPELA
jgi:hypothetical protein